VSLIIGVAISFVLLLFEFIIRYAARSLRCAICYEPTDACECAFRRK